MSPGPRAQPSGRTIGTPGCDLSGDGRLSAPAGRTARMTAPGSDADQLLELPGFVRDRVAEGRAKARATKQRKAAEAEITDVDPVARVLVDVPLAHLDRPFDYAVPVAMAEAAQPGVRVKVRFAGKDVDGFVVARAAASDHPGALAPLRRVVSSERVLSPQVAALTQELAERYAGTRSDVLRLAVSVVLWGATTVAAASITIMLITDEPLDYVLFDVISAFATCGLSTGFTQNADDASQYVLAATMFLGRIGTVTLAAALAASTRRQLFRRAEERPIVG